MFLSSQRILAAIQKAVAYPLNTSHHILAWAVSGIPDHT